MLLRIDQGNLYTEGTDKAIILIYLLAIRTIASLLPPRQQLKSSCQGRQ